ncbi:EF-hand domain-containing protein [Polyangium spumosum]|uniref:EF-hand domain-containing protein n=1 Tax=Polyangium spumosum TaxID=889282 RepID=A0A6N7PY27_9BACT|nr:EF-hand domain-containing protein [Polyangium spumosum]MRG96457.1 hypothetical protein [Polyangium spumosum]
MASRRLAQGLVVLATIAAASVAGAQGQGPEEPTLLDHAFFGLDTDGNGRIDRSEASTQLNMLVGAIFFEADRDADGVVSAEEAQATTASMPGLSQALGAVTGRMTGEELDALEGRIGLQWGEPITAGEAREAADRAVDELFVLMDRDEDGMISRRELHEGVRALLPDRGRQTR